MKHLLQLIQIALRICALLFFLTKNACVSAQPPPPKGLAAKGFERHLELRWQPEASGIVGGYEVFRSVDNGMNYAAYKTVSASTDALVEWRTDAPDPNAAVYYKVRSIGPGGVAGDFSAPVSAQTRPMSDEELLDMVQESTFRYFWDFAHPTSGLARERNTSGDIVTSGGSGFGILAILTGVQRGWVSREAALDRMVRIVSFLEFADRFHGAWPHWLNGATGNVVPFSQYDNGGDLVETAFLIQGLLAARQFFDGADPLEKGVRDAITDLWKGVEWDWYRRNNSGVLYWHWSPNFGWQMNFALRGFNETQIVYLLAAASPTHPIPASLYQSGWAAAQNYVNNSIQFGYKVYCGPFAGGPLFFAHYSYLGFDPRGIKDQFCNYFVRNRNHALIHRAYCIANPEEHKGYSADCWGLTAGDNPFGYNAHDPFPNNDNGTINPTAALASMPYTPEESMQALKHFYRVLGKRLWGIYGFYDGFNLDQNWFASSYLAIDQGPIVAMIENHRSGLPWKLFMKNPEIKPALDALGFKPDFTATNEADLSKTGLDVLISPNPAQAGTELNLEFSVLKPQLLSAELTDTSGRKVRTFFSDRRIPPGISNESVKTAGLPHGVYWLKIDNGERVLTKKIVITP
jgi:hypothetical protein